MSTAPVVIPTVEPTTKQREFYTLCQDPEAEEILFDGAIRSGKTQACCRQLAAWAFTYGGVYVVMRRHYQELEDSTKKAMLWGDGGMPAACPQELWKNGDKGYHAKDNKVVLWNGAEIIFRNAEDPKKAQAIMMGISLSGFFVDQVEEFDEDEYEELVETMCGRLSHPVGPRKGLYAANPGAETHWLYKRIVDPDTRQSQCRYLHATLFDNIEQLPADFVRRQRRRKGTTFYDRFILGRWGSFGGKRFQIWRAEQHVVSDFVVPKDWEITEGIDYGFANPTCCLWHAAAPDGHEYFVAEHYEAGRPISHHAAAIKKIRKDRNLAPSATWLDPSAWAGRGEFESPAFEFGDYGIDAGKAQNDRLGGWNRMDELLTQRVVKCSCPEPVRADNSPRLRMVASCPNLIRELPSLKVKKSLGGQPLDDVEKTNDHSCDTARYVLMSRPFYPVTEAEADGTGDDRTLNYVRRLMKRAQEGERSTLVMGG
jgi:PBSX family phage terminase large subunit